MFERFADSLRTPALRPFVPVRNRALVVDHATPALPAMPTPLVPTPLVRTSDPYGIRVVPLRPSSPWPLRRAHERVLNPFRAFPFRAIHLSRLMYVRSTD
jgi:hypothetical protein